MEKIVEITEVNNVNFGYKSKDFDGYCIETNIRKIYFVISNNQCCCEDWGYLTSEDNFNDYIGSKLKEVLEDKCEYAYNKEYNMIEKIKRDGLTIKILEAADGVCTYESLDDLLKEWILL